LLAMALSLLFGFGTNAFTKDQTTITSWQASIFCSESVQSPMKLEELLSAKSVDKGAAAPIQDELDLLEENDVFGEFFKVERSSVNSLRLQEDFYENGKKTELTEQFFVIWGKAKIINGTHSAAARFCLVSKNGKALRVKGVLTNQFSRYLTILSNERPNPFYLSGPSLPGNWTLAVHSIEFKNRLKKVQP
jgi:hypothetical protein